MKSIKLITLTLLCLASAQVGATQVPDGFPGDTLALVADKPITFSQLNTQLNSTAVVGLSTPALGTPERGTVILTLLDKAISLNLLYLDAIEQGRVKDPEYRREIKTFSDGLLAGLYRKHYLGQDIEVSEQEIKNFYEEYINSDDGLTDRLHMVIEAKLRKQKHTQRKQDLRQHLRNDTKVKLYTDRLTPADDNQRSHAEVIAEYGKHLITWGNAKNHLSTLNSSVDMQRRLEALNAHIDNALMAEKARALGLEKDPGFVKRLAEFSKTHLVNTHREKLIRAMQPNEEDLREYYENNRDRIAFKEHRKLQMVVLSTQEEADMIKARIEEGEHTIYQAALEHSIDPRAKQTMGDFGWVEKGSGFAQLDKLAFSLAPGELGGPVESPAGWHLVLVTDQREPRYTSIDDEETRKVTRRMLFKDKLNHYAVELRKSGYPVVVYEDNLNRLLLEEAQWMVAKTKDMDANPQRAQKILNDMRAMVD